MGLQGFYNKYYYYYLILFINLLCTETLIIKRSLQSAPVAMVSNTSQVCTLKIWNNLVLCEALQKMFIKKLFLLTGILQNNGRNGNKSHVSLNSLGARCYISGNMRVKGLEMLTNNARAHT